MTNIAQIGSARVIVGVDTHKDVHAAVAIDELGRRLAELQVPTTQAGCTKLVAWATGLGELGSWGIEGTGSYGAGLTKHLLKAGHAVIEVDRPDRKARRHKGKSDSVDAEQAARSVMSGVASARPKTGDAQVEMIRVLKVARSSAVKARTQASNALKALVVTAPEDVRESLRDLSTPKLVDTCSRFRLGDLDGPVAATKFSLRCLARRIEGLDAELKALSVHLATLTTQAAPKLLEVFGVGPDVAATLLITAGDNPERLASESAFAHLCGVSPIQASSGKTNRHRLNRGGDRRANAALYRIALVRMRYHEATKRYVAKRTAEGRTKAEIIRCLKRYVAREIFAVLKTMADRRLALAG